MTDSPKRKLAAIMFTDMVGYTTLMQKDETKARELIEMQRSLMAPYVKKHGGEVIQFVGDGTFCRFESAIEAVNAALEIQNIMEVEPELNLRIGIHVGDVVIEGDEVYGDGVNIAARIEPLAEPGGVCVSSRVRDDIKNQTGIDLLSLGMKGLKNVDEEIEVFSVSKSVETKIHISDMNKESSKGGVNKLKWLGVATLVTALVIIGLKIDFGTMDAESTDYLNSFRIAVLPFTNMSADAENEFFADGITEDILTQLSKIKSLEVISRTSIMQYKNTTKSMSQIAEELGVATILEGSVRRGGNRVRITAQLIDARTDKHIWANSYDRELDDIFAIQTDVAIKIAAALEASLTPDEEKRINEKPTDNAEAYDYYLRGNDYSRRSYDESNFNIGIKMYQKAIELDPNFALAYAMLSQSHAVYYWFYYDRSEERLIMSKEAADRALQINPQLPEAHIALGIYYYHGRLDYENALKEFAVAKELGLNNSDLYADIGYVKRRQGKMEQAKDNLLKAIKLNPRGSVLVQNLGETYSLLRNYPKSEISFNSALSLRPDEWTIYLRIAFLALVWKGDTEKARITLNEGEQYSSSFNNNEIVYLKYLIEIYDRQYQTALELLSYEKYDAYENQFIYFHKYHLMAEIYGLMGESKMAQVNYDSARVDYESLIEEHLEDSRLYTSLGLVYAGLGRREDAIRAGKKGVELLPIGKEAWRGAYRLEDLSVIYARVGEFALAIDNLETLLSIPGDLSVNLLKLDPKWDPLRDHPRFIALLEE